MRIPEFVQRYRAEFLLFGILLLAAFLNLWNIWNQGISNTYYAAAVKSMLENPVAGFFNSFDPAGFITIDKPPVGLWVQAAFAAVLGFQGWVLVLPQALAGVGSVALLYFIISRPFGKPAGLVAALALAVTPIFVAISRNGTMDTQLIFVLLLAVWAVLKAARERSLPWLIASVVLIGIGFNIKMIQAFIVVPAVLLVYFLGVTEFTGKKRALHLGIAVVVLLAVSLSWAVAVDMVPASERPYIGGSGDNTVLGLIIDYNGLHRLGIDDTSGGPGGSSGGQAGSGSGSGIIQSAGTTGSSFAGPGGNNDLSGTPPGSPGESPGGMTPPGQGSQQTGASGISGGAPGNMGGGMNSGGSPSIFRVFREGLAGDISWLLLFALIGVLAWIRRPATLSLTGLQDAGLTGERGLALIAMLLWLIPGLLYFSFTTGFFHDYYIATLAPPIAGLVGIGAVGMYQKYVSGGVSGWLLPVAVLVTGLAGVLFLTYNADFAGPLMPVVLFGTLACTGLLAWMQRKKKTALVHYRLPIVAVALGILFIAPLVWSCTPIMTGNGGNIPTAGPQGSGGGMIGGMPGGATFPGPGDSGIAGGVDRRGLARNQSRDGTGMTGGPLGTGPGTGEEDGSTSKLAAFLLAHTKNETWIVAVPSSQEGAGLIIATGKPVMDLGGFTGSDQVLDLTVLETYIHEDKVRYFETGGMSGMSGGGQNSGNSELFSWVSTHCTVVPASEWGGSAVTAGNRTGSLPLPGITGTGSAMVGGSFGGSANALYDCLGAA
ncbi:ArnT family glycosyltransferase [Methanoregula sp.]|uniref:ArnT family glycosyltransferase n=1 Tax=Methanoregula sp. TaxID=2052170 RepID=UPI002CE58A5D|nr:glycosyltransferase family 39 protein [Methanoregula sp.]HVP96707.1 glycosyltransferase family 39 protein [Methanoregula sp.]